MGHLALAAESFRVVAARLGGQRLDPRPGGQGGRRLVEAEVAVRADARLFEGGWD